MPKEAGPMSHPEVHVLVPVHIAFVRSIGGGDEKRERIEEACQQSGVQWLKPLREALPAEISFEEIRLVVANLRREKGNS